MTEAPAEERASFEHPIAFFPEEHYLAVRSLAHAAYEEHPPCQSYPELWWPTKGASTGRAAEICKTRCPMQEQCLAFALEVGEEDGIWGGTTPAERKAMLKKINRQDTPLDNPPSRTGTGGQDIPPPPAGSSQSAVQKGTARYGRACSGEQAPQPAADHRPIRDRESV